MHWAKSQEHLLHDLQQAAIELAHKQYAEALGKSTGSPATQRHVHNQYIYIYSNINAL